MKFLKIKQSHKPGVYILKLLGFFCYKIGGSYQSTHIIHALNGKILAFLKLFYISLGWLFCGTYIYIKFILKRLSHQIRLG